MKNIVSLPCISFLTSLIIQSNPVCPQETSIVQLSLQEASSYRNCHPENYTDWFVVNNGSDLYEVIEEVMEIYPEPITATTVIPSSTVIDGVTSALDITPTSTMSMNTVDEFEFDFGLVSTEAEQDEISASYFPDLVPTPTVAPEPSAVTTTDPPGGTVRKKRSAMSMPAGTRPLKRPSLEREQNRKKRSYYHGIVKAPEPDDKILLIFRSSNDPYAINTPVMFSHFSLGLCSVPSIPLARAKSYFELSDEAFSETEKPAILVSGSAQLNINNMQFDAHSWAVSSPLIFYRDTSSGHIVGSDFSRLEIRENGRRYYGDNSIIAAGEQGFWQVHPAPSLRIDDSRFFQGTDESTIIFALTGLGQLAVNNSYFVLASDRGSAEAIGVYYTDEVEIVGNTFVSCLRPISSEQYRALDQPIPADEYQFCESVTARFKWAPLHSAFWGSLNHLNFERNLIKGGWREAINLNGETLKSEGTQNTGNLIQDFYGKLCYGELSRYKPKGGAIGFSGLHDPCPTGRALADTQIPATLLPYLFMTDIMTDPMTEYSEPSENSTIMTTGGATTSAQYPWLILSMLGLSRALTR